MRSGWLLAAALLLGACGAEPAEQKAEGWQEVAAGPLSPREQALGLWTGDEVLLIGGSDDPPCPPNADCAADPTPLTDAAALDPATGAWRTIASPPVPVLGAQGVVIGPQAFVLPYAARSDLLVYRVEQDTWSKLPTPFDAEDGFALLAAGDNLIAYGGSDETGPRKDFLLDPRTAKWTTLPEDPLGPAFDRSMAWTGQELVLVGHELIPNPGAEKPTLARMAALNLTDRKWRRLPEAPMIGTGPWLAAGGKLVNPALGSEDGGEIGNWGRDYPYGGIVDPTTGAWSPLPGAPTGDALGGGARTATTALYPGLADHVLDVDTGAWERVPGPPGGEVSGRTVVTAGVRMLVFGGARKDKLLNTTAVWSPKP